MPPNPSLNTGSGRGGRARRSGPPVSSNPLAVKMQPRHMVPMLFVLSGCATCPMQQYFSPSIATSASVSSVSGGQHLYVTASSELRVDIFECGTAYKTQVDLPHFVCVSFRVRPGSQFRFESSNVLFRFPDGPSFQATLFRQEASTYKPVAETAAVSGERSDNAPPMQLLLSETQGWREVSTRVEAPATPTSNFVMEVPAVRVANKPTPLPPVSFRLVKEPVCVGGGW